VLTALLIPAFTRQWDDRQKAHDLKAALLDDMAAASSRALTDAHDLAAATSPAPTGNAVTSVLLRYGVWGATPPTEKRWSVSSLEVEAKLRTYFGAQLLHEWRDYRSLMDLTLAISAGRPVATPGFQLPQNQEKTRKMVVRYANALEKTRAEVGVDRSLRGLTKREVRKRQDRLYAQVVTFQGRLEALQAQLLTVEEGIADDVLQSHVTGYSTSWDDLLRDALP
jgi:hypothetical protein